jgi:hypothetical protein
MSPTKEINAFLKVLKQPDLFANQDWEELSQLADKLPEEKEKIWEQISQWLAAENRAKIKTAWEEKLKASPKISIKRGGTLGPGNCNPSQESESLKEQIQQSIIINSPLPKDKDKK